MAKDTGTKTKGRPVSLSGDAAAAFAAASRAAVFELTADGETVVACNDAAARLAGIAPAAISGSTLAGLLAPALAEPVASLVQTARAGGQPVSGGLQEGELQARVIPTAEGFVCVIGCTETVGRSAELQGRLLAVAAHEMRTPLASIIGFAQTMIDHRLNLSEQERETFLQIIVEQGDRLSRLVEELLVVAKIDGGRLQARPQRLDLVEVARQVLRDEEVGEDVLRVEDSMIAWADPDHAYRILQNFVANARAYGNGVRRLRISAAQNSVIVSVCDEGDGVEEQLLPRLFGLFAQGSHGAANSSGLGLAITRGLARANGGDVWHEPNRPRGACFCLRLPCFDPDC